MPRVLSVVSGPQSAGRPDGAGRLPALHTVRYTKIIRSLFQMIIMISSDTRLAVPTVVTGGSRGYRLGQMILQTFRMPAHLVTEVIRLWPMVQPIAQP